MRRLSIMVKAVVGANWGDEGKGKITDTLADKADVVIRFQGGANAGHTIVNDYGKFALHTMPSGVFHQHIMNIIGNGVAFDITKFMKELNEITSKGVPMPQIMISDRVQVMMPYHVLFDTLEEARLAGKSFGSTKSGIAPFYSDKFAKIGWQINEFFQDDDVIKEKIARIAEIKDVLLVNLYHSDPIDQEALFNQIVEWREQVKEYVGNVSLYLDEAIKEGKTILLEGQLGTMKDPDHGIYPMVTSSSPLAAYGAIGAGIPPYEIKQIVTVSKAYSSAVGAGAFVSELFGDEAEELRRRGGDGGEYGATTGRPRRVGWYDCVASKYGCRLQGTTDVAFTVLDVLGYLDEIPVCVGYDIDGEVTTEFPVTHLLDKAKPVFETLPGWKCDIRGIKNYEDLPENCRKYIEFIEEHIGYPITMVSNGPARTDIIYRESKLSK
jgi:adenylosuccinate synthase